MKKLDFGQTLGLLANAGVIAGIGLLAFELSQNNELLRNEARFNLLVHRSSEIDEVVQSPDLGELWSKGRNGIEMTEGEL